MERMPLEEIGRRADANYAEAYRQYAVQLDGETYERGGLYVVSVGVPISMFNQAFVMRPLDDPKRLIAEATRFFDERELPFVVRVREGVDPDAERACEELGLPYSDTAPGMVLEDLSRDYRAVDGLDIRTARDGESLQQHVDILIEAFHMPAELGRRLITERMLDAPDVELYVGYVDGEPVATSALIASSRVAGVYNVATRASHRGHGIGEAITAHAVKRGASMGCLISSLQASQMGYPVYERMGFQMLCPYRTFHRQTT
jgi:GNAT superfamily N-acetyltransferase